MQQRICAIGVGTVGSDITDLDLDSKRALYDFDLIIVRPGFDALAARAEPWRSDTRFLYSPGSGNVQDQFAFWKGQIEEALSQGKTVFVLGAQPERLAMARREKPFRLLGALPEPDYFVESYSILPEQPKITNAGGTQIVLDTGSEAIAKYWDALRPHSTYSCHFDHEAGKSILKTATGDHSVGMILPGVFGGRYVFLPDVPNLGPEMSGVGNKGFPLAELLRGIDTELRSTYERTPPPEWAGRSEFQLATINNANEEISKLDAKIQELDNEVGKQERRISAVEPLRALLYEQSGALEDAVILALKVLGFKAEYFDNGTEQFDALFESPEGRFLGEVEGRNKKAIAVKKFRQLADNVNSFMDHDDQEDEPKGVLFGNGSRQIDPADRGDCFTSTVIKRAENRSMALVDTSELFQVVKYLDANDDPEFATSVRLAMFSAVGLVIFPPAPTVEAT